jgi:hypothetical protein
MLDLYVQYPSSKSTGTLQDERDRVSGQQHIGQGWPGLEEKRNDDFSK